MEKRVLLAVVLSFVVLYGYQALYPPPKPQPKAGAATGAPAGAPAAPTPGPNAEAASPTTAPAACGRASRSGARRRHGRARHPVRERVGHGRVHHAWGRAQELAAEEVSGCRSRTARADPANAPARDSSSIYALRPGRRHKCDARAGALQAERDRGAGDVCARDAHVRVSGRQRPDRAQGILVRPDVSLRDRLFRDR